MVRKILVPLRDSKLSWKAYRHALSVFTDADVVVMHVVDPQETHYGEGQLLYDDDEYERVQADARNLLEEASRVADDEFGRSVEAVLAVNRVPEDAILSYVEDAAIDHVVIGSHDRRNVLDVVLGSVTRSVVRNCPVPVTVVR
ncbi:MAG: universal stress protein [Haloferacaceae archaeon]